MIMKNDFQYMRNVMLNELGIEPMEGGDEFRLLGMSKGMDVSNRCMQTTVSWYVYTDIGLGIFTSLFNVNRAKYDLIKLIPLRDLLTLIEFVRLGYMGDNVGVAFGMSELCLLKASCGSIEHENIALKSANPIKQLFG